MITAAEAQEAWETFVKKTPTHHWPERAPWSSPGTAVAEFSSFYGSALIAKRCRRWRLLEHVAFVLAVIFATAAVMYALVTFQKHALLLLAFEACFVYIIYTTSEEAEKRVRQITNWEAIGIPEDHDSVRKLMARLGLVIKLYADRRENDNWEFLRDVLVVVLMTIAAVNTLIVFAIKFL